MAERDVPAVLDTIFKTTGQQELYVVGYSMGGTTLFALLSENHAYDNKVKYLL